MGHDRRLAAAVQAGCRNGLPEVVRGGGFKWEILRAVGRVALPASWNQLFVFFAGFVVKGFQNP